MLIAFTLLCLEVKTSILQRLSPRAALSRIVGIRWVIRKKYIPYGFLKSISLLAEYQLLYRHECFSAKYDTHKIHTKLHPGPEWRISISSPLSYTESSGSLTSGWSPGETGEFEKI